MYVDFWKIFRVVLLLFIGALIGMYSLKTYENFKTPKQTVTVTGTGEVDAATDQATISIQVTNSKDAQTLKTALIDLGIPESRITQSSYGGPIYQVGTNSAVPMMYPRPASNISFTVVLDSLKNIEKVFSVINTNPNTQISNTYYSLNNRKNWETKAKEAALNDARQQVESVAKINHLTIGKLVSLTDTNPQSIIQPMMLKGSVGSNGTTSSNVTAQPLAQATQPENQFYSEQTVKVTASYTVEYELY